MNTQGIVGTVDRALVHEVFNHMHVILGNLELLEEDHPHDQLVKYAREAALEVNRLLRATWKT